MADSLVIDCEKGEERIEPLQGAELEEHQARLEVGPEPEPPSLAQQIEAVAAELPEEAGGAEALAALAQALSS